MTGVRCDDPPTPDMLAPPPKLTSRPKFPDHYTPVHDFINHPMNPTLATLIFIADLYFVLKTYVLEKPVVDVAHKKYASLGTTLFMAAHGIGSMSELTLGYMACLDPSNVKVRKTGGALLLHSSLWLSRLCRFLVANNVLTSQTLPPLRLASLVARRCHSSPTPPRILLCSLTSPAELS